MNESNILYVRPLSKGRLITYSGPLDQLLGQVRQIHSADVIEMTADQIQGDLREADGMVVFWPSLIPLLIKTADCLPIVMIGERGYAHVHAGWRGLQKGILRQEKLAKLLPYMAIIGPSIRPCCFEVGTDFAAHFPQSPFLQQREGRTYFDLQGEAGQQLRELFPSLELQDSGLCTCCDLRFHSYRRDKTSLRNHNVYWPE